MPYLFFGCAVGIFFFALLQLTAGNKRPLHYFMVIGCLAAAYVMLYLWAANTGVILHFPALANSDNAAVLISAPALCIASLTILHGGKRPVRSSVVFFLFPILVAVFSIVYNALVAPAKLIARGTLPNHFSNPILISLTFVSGLSLVGAILVDLLAARRLYRARQILDRPGFLHQVLFLCAYLCASIVIVLGSALKNDRLYEIGCLMTCLLIASFALSRTTVFYFTHDRSARDRRKKRPDWDGSADELNAKLSALMRREEPYRDEKLSLRKLASMLGEDPNRVSYHLNVNLSSSFRAYINDLRLAAVCRDLIANPLRSILDTAFGNGFNSKSSFNTLFFQKYGKTPKEFRRENLGRLKEWKRIDGNRDSAV